VFKETKQTPTGVSFARRKSIIKRNAGVSTQTSNQRVATKVVSWAKILDRGTKMESIAKITREEKKGYSTQIGLAQDSTCEPESHRVVVEPDLDQMR
jgi:hypothetical protein